MELHLSLCLPRDVQSVPVVRHICTYSLRELGVDGGCLTDIEIALSEACTNVLDHSGPGDEYEVKFECDDDRCIIRVIDRGRGFDFNTLPAESGELTAERGRGVGMMHALVDRVKFVSKPETGTVVHLEKDLSYDPGAPIAQLATSKGHGHNS